MKRRNLLLLMTVLLLCSGCSAGYDESTAEPGEAVEGSPGNAQEQKKDGTAEETEALAEGYRDLYEEAEEDGREDSLELKQAVVDYLGGEGYAASDRDDQINMANYQQAEEFCRKAQKKEAAELTLFSVLDEGKLIRYDMETRDGRINVVLNSLQWKDGVPQVFYTHEFEAHTWEYTDKGYLFVEEYQPAGYDGPPGRIGFRLTIEAVWERKGLDCAVQSELVVRPLENGGFQYVSNHVSGWDEDLEFVWYSPRLTDEEWDTWYGEHAGS